MNDSPKVEITPERIIEPLEPSNFLPNPNPLEPYFESSNFLETSPILEAEEEHSGSSDQDIPKYTPKKSDQGKVKFLGGRSLYNF
jgi:hypothetical protein